MHFLRKRYIAEIAIICHLGYYCFVAIYSLMSCESAIFPLMLYIFNFSCSFICGIMEKLVLIGSRMRGHKRSRDRQLTWKTEATNLVTTRASWFWQHSKLIFSSILWLIFTFGWFVLIYPKLLVNSTVDIKMVSTRKRKQQNKKLFGQLSERDTDFMIGKNNQDEQIESRDNIIYRGTSSDNVSNPTQANYPQVDVHTLEENVVSKVRSEMDNVLTSVKTRVQDAVLTARKKLVISRVELATKSTNAPAGRSGVLTVTYWNLIRGFFRYYWRPTNDRFK